MFGLRSAAPRRTPRGPRARTAALGTAALALALAPAPRAGADTIETWEEAKADASDATRFQPGYEKLPVAWAKRPLTMPSQLFELEFLLSARGAPGPLVDVLNTPRPGTDPTVRLGLSARVRYGITDGSEVVLRPPSLLFQDGVVLSSWSISYVGRLVRLDAFELGLSTLFAPQSLDGMRIGGGVPLLLRFGERARLDAAPSAAVVFRAAGVELDTRTELALALQLDRALRLGPRVELRSEATRRFEVELGLEGVYTFKGQRGAALDLTFGFAFPRALARGPQGAGGTFETWVATAGVRIFLPAERWL